MVLDMAKKQDLTTVQDTDILEENGHDTVTIKHNANQDDYESEFERIMQEQEKQEIARECAGDDVQSCIIVSNQLCVPLIQSAMNQFSALADIGPIKSNNLTQTTTQTNSQRVNSSNLTQCIKEPQTKGCAIQYPPELNPFGNEESGGDGEEVTVCQMMNTREASTNPFGDSEEEENPSSASKPMLTRKPVLPPQPAPRRSFSMKNTQLINISSNPFWKNGEEPTSEEIQRKKAPVPLPRITSKSMPSTPNQSPLLHLNRSFRLPGSGSSLSSSNASAYNSIRRKKKLAPPPPVQPPSGPATMHSTLIEHSQSQTASQKTVSRPRKARPAPPPPPKPFADVRDVNRQH